MQQKKLCYVLFVSMLLLHACHSSTHPGAKIWFYTHSTGSRDVADSTLNPASFMCLEKDGSYTSDLGHFDYGKWVYAINTITLISHQHSKSIIPVTYLTEKEMQTGPPKGPFDNFESQPLVFSAAGENPFSMENNRWRIHALAKETGEQIKNRLLNHFKFWEAYFSWAFNYNVQYIDVRSTPTLLKIYGNGFSLKPTEQLPPTWKSYFFDEEDCRIANEKIKILFDSNAIAWPHTDNRYKMFISVFQQMQQKLK